MTVYPGLMVNHNVRLTKPLGEGAMGSVWFADHLSLNTEVAVKFIAAEVAALGGEILARFTQEASIAAQIRSPHVVQIFDHGVMGDGTPYIVMELLDGESLMQWLERRGRLTMKEAGIVLAHVARALRKSHELGVVHRDIKPDNIYVHVSEDGLFCKVLDFGIAKQTRLPSLGLTNVGTMVGTPEYMSPEQVLHASDVDHRADLWALSVTAYQMLTGQLPFAAENLGTLCVKLLDGTFPPPRELRADLPLGTNEWFRRALAHDPAKRFQTATDLAKGFQELVVAHANDHDDDRGLLHLSNPDLGPQNRLLGLSRAPKRASNPNAGGNRDQPARGSHFVTTPPDVEAPRPKDAVAQASTHHLPNGTLSGSSTTRRAGPRRRSSNLGRVVLAVLVISVLGLASLSMALYRRGALVETEKAAAGSNDAVLPGPEALARDETVRTVTTTSADQGTPSASPPTATVSSVGAPPRPPRSTRSTGVSNPSRDATLRESTSSAPGAHSKQDWGF
ncbi:MAG: protein kinase [Myxococcota bacterium]